MKILDDASINGVPVATTAYVDGAVADVSIPGPELPNAGSLPDGKLLGVESGAWTAVDAPSGGGAGGGATLGDADWIAPTLTNGWQDYDTGRSVRFRKDAMGWVHLEGMAKDGSGSAFTLPVGYRPETDRWYRFSGAISGGVSVVNIADDGTVTPASPTFSYFDGISFLAAGETGQIVTGGGGSAASAISAVTMYLAASVSFAANTPTVVPFDTVDSGTGWDTAAHQFTASADGTYIVMARVGLTATLSRVLLRIHVNGAERYRGDDRYNESMVGLSAAVTLTAGDLLDIRVTTPFDSGTLDVGQNLTHAEIVGPLVGVGTGGGDSATLTYDRHVIADLGAGSVASATSTAEVHASLRCTVDVPPDGKLVVRQSLVGYAAGGVELFLYASVDDGTTWTKSGGVASTGGYIIVSGELEYSGLTAGAPATVLMGWGSSAANIHIYGSANGQAYVDGTWQSVFGISGGVGGVASTGHQVPNLIKGSVVAGLGTGGMDATSNTDGSPFLLSYDTTYWGNTTSEDWGSPGMLVIGNEVFGVTGIDEATHPGQIEVVRYDAATGLGGGAEAHADGDYIYAAIQTSSLGGSPSLTIADDGSDIHGYVNAVPFSTPSWFTLGTVSTDIDTAFGNLASTDLLGQYVQHLFAGDAPRYILVDEEVMHIEGVGDWNGDGTGGSYVTVLRGVWGSTAAAHTAGAVIRYVFGPGDVRPGSLSGYHLQDSSIPASKLSSDSDWTAPDYVNGWVDFGGSTYSPTGFRKTIAGLVIFRGLPKDGTPGSVMFTLPVGYRPAYSLQIPITPGGYITIAADGTVTSGSSSSYAGLDGITFYAEA